MAAILILTKTRRNLLVSFPSLVTLILDLIYEHLGMISEIQNSKIPLKVYIKSYFNLKENNEFDFDYFFYGKR